tara:strand:- start:3714 stop:4694 length:981 start_codon:yes stop_codon:yes gene_type:complete
MQAYPYSISIVMPCLNRVDFIRSALESIFSQGVSCVEVIIADGGSTDGTLDILREYADVKVIVEDDKSLYDALNKAIKKATGDIIGHLNTDDIYLPDTFNHVRKLFKKFPETQMLCGGAELAKYEFGGWRVVERYAAQDYGYLNWDIVLKGPILTNARFYQREFLSKMVPFDLNYRIIADREFLIRVMNADPKSQIINRNILQYRFHESSLTFNRNAQAQWAGASEKLKLSEALYLASSKNAVQREMYSRWAVYEARQALIVAIKTCELKKIFSAYSHGAKFSGGGGLPTVGFLFKFGLVKIIHRLKSAQKCFRRIFGLTFTRHSS